MKDGVVPAIKDPGHDSELLMVSDVSLAISAQVLVTLKLRLRRASAVFGENRIAVSFFYKYDLTKDFLEI